MGKITPIHFLGQTLPPSPSVLSCSVPLWKDKCQRENDADIGRSSLKTFAHTWRRRADFLYFLRLLERTFAHKMMSGSQCINDCTRQQYLFTRLSFGISSIIFLFIFIFRLDWTLTFTSVGLAKIIACPFSDFFPSSLSPLNCPFSLHTYLNWNTIISLQTQRCPASLRASRCLLLSVHLIFFIRRSCRLTANYTPPVYTRAVTSRSLGEPQSCTFLLKTNK